MLFISNFHYGELNVDATYTDLKYKTSNNCDISFKNLVFKLISIFTICCYETHSDHESTWFFLGKIKVSVQ